MATGTKKLDQQDLILNKVLCGLALQDEIQNTLAITDSEKTEMENLLTAVIGHWKEVNGISIEAFRSNWLLRSGILQVKENQFELYVEEFTFDILLNTFPTGYSIIVYPWMNKPLIVKWP